MDTGSDVGEPGDRPDDGPLTGDERDLLDRLTDDDDRPDVVTDAPEDSPAAPGRPSTTRSCRTSSRLRSRSRRAGVPGPASGSDETRGHRHRAGTTATGAGAASVTRDDHRPAARPQPLDQRETTGRQHGHDGAGGQAQERVAADDRARAACRRRACRGSTPRSWPASRAGSGAAAGRPGRRPRCSPGARRAAAGRRRGRRRGGGRGSPAPTAPGRSRRAPRPGRKRFERPAEPEGRAGRPRRDPTSAAAKSPTIPRTSWIPNAAAAADMRMVSLGRTGTGPSAAIMTARTGRSQRLCRQASNSLTRSTVRSSSVRPAGRGAGGRAVPGVAGRA